MNTYILSNLGSEDWYKWADEEGEQVARRYVTFTKVRKGYRMDEYILIEPKPTIIDVIFNITERYTNPPQKYVPPEPWRRKGKK